MKRSIMAVAAAVVMISPVSAEVYFSPNFFMDVQSTSDSHGNFTYTFWGASLNPDFAYYFTPGYGTISLHAYGVLELQTPSDWQGSVSTDGLVTWQYTGPGGVWMHNTPLTFGLSSSIFATTLYNDEALYPQGVVSGPFCQYCNPNNGGWGTDRFAYLGPVVPEPSAITLCLLGSISLGLASRRSSQRKAEQAGCI